MNITGAIFDLDGTLLDSMFVWDTIGADYLLSRGIAPEPGLNEIFKSMSIVQAAQYYQQRYAVTDSIESIIDGVNGMIEHLYSDVVQSKPGVVDMLARLHGMGVNMCIATATDRYMVEAALNRNGMADYFSHIFTCTEVGAGKDEPVIFERALAHLGTDKASTWVFEDAPHAIQTAVRAGFNVAAVYDKSFANEWSHTCAMARAHIEDYMEWSEAL